MLEEDSPSAEIMLFNNVFHFIGKTESCTFLEAKFVAFEGHMILCEQQN